MQSRFIASFFVALFLACAPGHGCSVPVFRYALEKWEPSRFEAIIFHSGALSASDQALVDAFNEARQKSNANLEVLMIDVAVELNEPFKKLWEQDKQRALPHVVLRHGEEAEFLSLWSGPLKALNTSQILDSPARQRVVKNLLAGESAVWVLLESGNKQEDDAAYVALGEQLESASKTLTLPEPDPEDPKMHSSLPLRIHFAIERVSRTDPAEELFVRMLLATPPAPKEVTGPAVVPVFGRGRALQLLSGETRTKEQVALAAEFLAGECSCEIKEMNPGSDLLLAANWDDIYSEIPEKVVAAPQPVIASSAQVPATINPDQQQSVSVITKSKLLPIAIAGAGLLVIITGLVVFRNRSKKSNV